MIKFKTVRWKNFLSTGDVWNSVDLDFSERTLIIGENGAGKSTFYEAITFALYGKPFRNINKPNLVNSKNKKGAIVELEFETGGKTYLIRRGLKPVIFEIIVNGVSLAHASTVKDHQEFLEKNIIKMSYKSFTQVVVLGAGNYTSFMNLPAAHRREIIEDLLDINVFTKMNGLLKSKMDDLRTFIREIDDKITMENNKQALLESHLKKLARGVKKEIAGLTESMEELKEKISTIDIVNAEKMAEKEALSKKIADLGDPNAQIQKLRADRTVIITKIESTNKTLKFFSENDECSLCRQGIEHDHKNKIISDRTTKKTAYASTLERIETRLEEFTLISDQLVDLKDKWMKTQHEIDKNLAIKAGYEKSYHDLARKLSNISSEEDGDVQSCKDDLIECRKKIKALSIKKNSSEDLMNTYNIAVLLLKDGGIKSAIIKQYIPIMNTTINRYLSMMDFNVDFNVDENFSEVIRSAHRDEFTYNSFSEGEKARIDLALLFAWRAVARMKNSINCNLLILDEVFDGSLDGSGMDELFKILNSLSGTRAFVISHKTEVLTDKFDNVIRFEKHGGFSRIVKEK